MVVGNKGVKKSCENFLLLCLDRQVMQLFRPECWRQLLEATAGGKVAFLPGEYFP
jgi:hypothetical protein